MNNIIIGLISVMIANVLFGVTLAGLKEEFSKEKLIQGLVKYGSIILGILLIYVAGTLNEDIVVTNIDGVQVNLMAGIRVLFVSAIIYYGTQDLLKLRDLLGLQNNINDKEDKG